VVGFTQGFLYARLADTDKRSALRQAQLATKTRYGHSYYWAAFQLTGATESIYVWVLVT
jgi:CHAT domain-containing protein